MKTKFSCKSCGRGSNEAWARERNRWWRNCLLGTMYSRNRWFDGQHRDPNKLADIGWFFFATRRVVGRTHVHRSFLNGGIRGSQTRAGVCDGSKNERESYNRCGDDGKFVEHVLVCRLTVQKRLSIINTQECFLRRLKSSVTLEIESQVDSTQPQRIRDHRDRAERHRGASDNWAQ